MSVISKIINYLINLIRESLDIRNWKLEVWVGLMLGETKWKKGNIRVSCMNITLNAKFSRWSMLSIRRLLFL